MTALRTEVREHDVRFFKVKAGLIAKASYATSTSILLVTLRTGRSFARYRYWDVPESVYNALLAAESPAKVYDELVKKPGYKYDRVVI